MGTLKEGRNDMKYLVQAILIDGDIETIIDSFKTDNYTDALEFVMKRHKSSTNYLYIAMNRDTQEVIIRTRENKFIW